MSCFSDPTSTDQQPVFRYYLPLCGSRTGTEGLTVCEQRRWQEVQPEPKACRRSGEERKEYEKIRFLLKSPLLSTYRVIEKHIEPFYVQLILKKADLKIKLYPL